MDGISMDETWHLPDHEAWRDEPGYSPAAALALREAHRRLRGRTGALAAYWEALDCLLPGLRGLMSARQRAHALYIAALALANDDPPTTALDCIEEALALASELGETTGRMELLMLRASINRAILQIPDAAADLRDYLALLDACEDRGAVCGVRPTTSLGALLHLAGSEWLLGETARSAAMVARASTLLSRVAGSRLQAGELEWLRALLLRDQGELHAALTHARFACQVYADDGPAAMASRIAGVTAEIALDLSSDPAYDGGEPTGAAALQLADRYSRQALDLAAHSDMQSSIVMARITHARFELSSAAPGERVAELKELAAMCKAHRDVALEAQAYTQLGRECEAMGDLVAAQQWYRQAEAILLEHQLAALAAPATVARQRLSADTVESPL